MVERHFPIKGRFILAIWFIPFIYLPGESLLYQILEGVEGWYWGDLLFIYYYDLLLASLMAILFYRYRINWRAMLARPARSDYWPAIKLTTFIFVFSVFALYVLFLPLSYVVPDFVQVWLIDLPPIVYGYDDGFPILANLLSLITLVVMAPLLEEFAFRGILLHRWIPIMGMNKAILLSSVLFGIAHPDPIGATAFGIAMSILYLKTGTLWVPMLCHALNNLVVWILELGFTIHDGPGYVYTLKEFQTEWPFAIGSGVIVLVWVFVYLKGPKSRQAWRLPRLG